MKQTDPKLLVLLPLVTVLTGLFRDSIWCGVALLVAGLLHHSDVLMYWFAWQAFYPQTGLWRAE